MEPSCNVCRRLIDKWACLQAAGSNETWQQELDRYVTYFKMPNYQTVDIGEKGRPLVFSFGRGLNLTHLARPALLRSWAKFQALSQTRMSHPAC